MQLSNLSQDRSDFSSYQQCLGIECETPGSSF